MIISGLCTKTESVQVWKPFKKAFPFSSLYITSQHIFWAPILGQPLMSDDYCDRAKKHNTLLSPTAIHSQEPKRGRSWEGSSKQFCDSELTFSLQLLPTLSFHIWKCKYPDTSWQVILFMSRKWVVNNKYLYKGFQGFLLILRRKNYGFSNKIQRLIILLKPRYLERAKPKALFCSYLLVSWWLQKPCLSSPMMTPRQLVVHHI